MKEWGLGVGTIIVLGTYVVCKALFPIAVVVFIIYMILWILCQFF